MGQLLQFRKPARTTPEADAARQVSRSEWPADFIEAVKHITRAQQPLSITWSHLCPCKGMDNIWLEDGQICPNCFKGSDGKYHGR